MGESRPGPPSEPTDCPFCEGHEHETPHEIAAFRDQGTGPDSLGWTVRVVPNRFPAVRSQLTFPRHDVMTGHKSTVTKSSLFQGRISPGFGVHEVLIESPTHVADFADLDDEQITRVLTTYRDRLRVHRENKHLAYVQVFKNQGARAGASLEHVHSQILGMPFVPRRIEDELEGLRRHREEHGDCGFCRLIMSELAEEVRVIERTSAGGFVAISAFAGRFSHEMWVLPIHHGRCLGDCDRGQLEELAGLLRSVLRRLEAVAGRLDYNLIVHVAPNQSEVDFHWHIEILPRVNEAAGFEWGTGVSINAVLPEDSAERMRAVHLA